MKQNVSLLELEQNTQIGLFFVASNDFVLSGKTDLKPEQKKAIEKILQVPLFEITTHNNDLVGVFLQIDRYSNTIYAPKTLKKNEIKQLEDISKQFNYTLEIISSTQNTLGNLLSFTKKEVFISKELKEYAKEIEQKSDKHAIIIKNSEFHQAGALIYSTHNKTLASSEFSDSELESIEKYIDNISTVNNGSAYISSGIIANSFGILIGAQTTTVEIQTILETLDFL